MALNEKGFVLGTPKSIIDAMAQGDVRTACASLLELSKSADSYGLPGEFLEETATALDTGDWDRLSEPFKRCDFVGKDGAFLLLGPYTVRRRGRKITTLMAIYGQVIPQEPIVGLEAELGRTFGALTQPVTVILPINVIAACGMVGREDGEAFLVPDGWRFAGSEAGPVLNDMGEQRRRLSQSAFECLRRIFEPRSADLLVGPLENEFQGLQVQHREYQYHEAGHASGNGLQRKLSRKLLSTLWSRAVEEWRADGVEFEIARQMLPSDKVAQLIGANFCIRFGIDAHRIGGLDLDVDVNAALLTFDSLFRNDVLEFDDQGRLALTNPSHPGLVQAVQLHCMEAMQLTRSELNMSDETALGSLYGTIPVSSKARVIFRTHVVQPCMGIFTQLQ